ncbi:MAG: UDP-N-acetylmuramoyl-tripeptide--D-alanyl-D-alanine ligase [Clostridia bacterium]|nr:UDP-N-acetylmuramoyl-tripeptide--D-alanyl-D-alanine ligase [Clostridia bacterium]
MKTHFSIQQISFGTLARLCGGELYQGALGEVAVKYICTDSREADGQTAFVALRGARVDGHDYISAALRQGCRCVICEHRTEELERSDATAIVVNDSELALSKLASAYRKYLSCHPIGVTGSVGKTTTKDLIASVLSARHKTYCTPGNHNSQIGMPLSMLETPLDSTWSVMEMGMSNFGEVERLSIAVEPEIAVITNIGSSHMEALGSRENICRAKLEILCGLQNGGLLLLNGDEPLLRGIQGKNYRTIYVSLERKDADFYATNIRVCPNGTYFDAVWQGHEEKDLFLRVVGRHNVYAALFAIAIGCRAGLSMEEIRAGLAAYAPRGMRQNIYSVGPYTLIEDCYNASPESVKAAVDVLESLCRGTQQRSVAVLGDMLDLGPNSPAMHRGVGSHLAQRGIDLLFTLGQGGGQIAVGARQGGMAEDRIHHTPEIESYSQTVEALLSRVREGDVILFKASRGVGAERMVAQFKEAFSVES